MTRGCRGADVTGPGALSGRADRRSAPQTRTRTGWSELQSVRQWVMSTVVSATTRCSSATSPVVRAGTAHRVGDVVAAPDQRDLLPPRALRGTLPRLGRWSRGRRTAEATRGGLHHEPCPGAPVAFSRTTITPRRSEVGESVHPDVGQQPQGVGPTSVEIRHAMGLIELLGTRQRLTSALRLLGQRERWVARERSPAKSLHFVLYCRRTICYTEANTEREIVARIVDDHVAGA